MKFLIKGIKNTTPARLKINASSKEEAQSKAYAQGLIPIEIIQILPKNIFLNLSSSCKKELIMTFRQIAFMTEATLAIDEILGYCINGCTDTKIQMMYQEILKDLQSGLSLSQAFKKHTNIIGEMQASIIEVGQNTGNLPQTFTLLAHDMEEDQKDISKFKKKMFYPFIVLLSICIAFGVLNAMVIPEFITLFEEFKLELPLATKMLIMLGDLAQKWGILIAIAGAFLGVLTKKLLANSGKMRQNTHKYLLKIPMIGNIFLYRELQRCLFALYICQKTGMDFKTSLKNAHSCLSNHHLKNLFSHIITDIQKGQNLSSAIKKTDLFNPIITGLIVAGEKSGNLENIFQMCSKHYKELYSQKLDSFAQWVEPALTLLIGGLVLWFALGIMMPMWNLNGI